MEIEIKLRILYSLIVKLALYKLQFASQYPFGRSYKRNIVTTDINLMIALRGLDRTLFVVENMKDPMFSLVIVNDTSLYTTGTLISVPLSLNLRLVNADNRGTDSNALLSPPVEYDRFRN